MIEPDGSIVKFSVDPLMGDLACILWPTLEDAREIKSMREARGGIWEINRVVIFETTNGGVICA